MFRYTLALLLLNTSYQSLGAPTNSNETFFLAKKLLNNLSNQCENVFLVTQIKSQMEYCSDLSSVRGQKLRCFMFYDINSQLCQAVGEAKLVLTQDYSDKINEEQDVNTLCDGAKEWTFSNITAFPLYKSAVDKVFIHPVACGKICGVEDLMSDDANFFCKYYKWGSDLLKAAATMQGTGSAANATVPNSGTVAEAKPEVFADSNNDLTDVQIKNNSITTIQNVSSSATSASSSDVQKTEAKSEAISQGIVANNQPSIPPANADTVENLPLNNVEDPLLAPENTQDNKEDDKETEVMNSKSEPNLNVVQKPETPQNQSADNSLNINVDKEIQMLNNELVKKEPVIDNPKDNQKKYDPEDYAESDEGKDTLGDMQGGDDGDDSVAEDLNNKPEEQKPLVKKIDSSIVSPYTGESEYYPNTIQDGFSDDDDHFFSLFLTAIIIVVLLYILYHNKSKVSKMFFGLILEGRQSNRRRNSRGHAYKRLDTLEQAMSTNSAAPPSKIIY